MDPELQRFEDELEQLSPSSLPEGLISRMEAAMESWECETSQVADEVDKVVPFPNQEEAVAPEPRRRSSIWAAAASVALLGGVAAMIFTANPAEKSNETVETSSSVVNPSSVRPVEFAPEAAKRTIVDASEPNVIIPNGARPMRLMRFDYVDRIIFRNEAGEEVHLEVPGTNYRLVPAPTD
jgi:hypothetical protein